MNIVDGRTKFISMCNEIRNKYYPTTSIENETMLEWISRSTDEYGLNVWFSLWQEAIDILRLVDEASIPKNRHFLRYMETEMTNPTFQGIFWYAESWHGARLKSSSITLSIETEILERNTRRNDFVFGKGSIFGITS